MSHQHLATPADAGTGTGSTDGTPAVVEWGSDARPSGRIGSALAKLRANPRLAPVLAGLAAPALLGSLLADWRVWTVPQVNNDNGEFPVQRFGSGVVSFPTVGTGYLIGLFALAGCFVLARYGTESVRRNARLAGLATVGVLLAVLIAAMGSLDQLGGVIEDLTLNGSTSEEVTGSVRAEATYAAGLYLAFGGVLGSAVALLVLAPAGGELGPHAGGARARSGMAASGQDKDATRWSGRNDEDDWRHSRDEDRQDQAPARPVDLTVAPTAPFLPPPD